MPKCACGCGRECNKTYVSGHNFRGHHQSQEVKDRISKVHKGKHKTEEEKEYISKRTKLAMASPEIRQKISNAKKDKPNYKLRGTKKSEETKNKISEAKKGIPAKNNKPIIIDGVEYYSLFDASDKLNIPPMTIKGRVLSKNISFNNYQYK